MKKPLITWSASLIGALALCSVAAPARAQENTPPPSNPPPSSAPPPGGSNFGGGALGIGAVTWLGIAGNQAEPVAGAQVVYDVPVFHLEGVLGYSHVSVNNGGGSDVRFGVAGWYHLARGTNADFSVGGGAGLIYTSAGVGAANASSTGFTLEPGAEARVFLTPNFALSCRVGFSITFGDNNSATVFSLNGQTTGAFGFTYFFR